MQIGYIVKRILASKGSEDSGTNQGRNCTSMPLFDVANRLSDRELLDIGLSNQLRPGVSPSNDAIAV